MVANVLDVVAKALTVATNFLKFYMACSDGVAFMVGASSNGLFVAWAVDLWGSSISSFPLPSSVSIGEVSSFCCYIAPPLWCQSDTLLLHLLPLGEHAADW